MMMIQEEQREATGTLRERTRPAAVRATGRAPRVLGPRSGSVRWKARAGDRLPIWRAALERAFLRAGYGLRCGLGRRRMWSGVV